MLQEIRNATDTEIAVIAALWHDCWHDAHAEIVPAQLTRLRTPESFIERTKAYKAQIRVAVLGSSIVGLCITKEDELYQLYVAPAARGTGTAQLLMPDAEQKLRSNGTRCAYLVCAIGNERASRFYTKSGWTQVRS
jgi:GNAT superfamily N-acetyltransferase